MPEVTKTRELSILTKTPTHYLVKYTGSKTYKVRTRDLFRLKGEIQNMVSYATAFIIGSGTETEMVPMKTSRETSQSSSEASTKPPTLPSTQHTGQPDSSSLPTTRRPAKRKRTTNTPMRQSKTSRKVPLSKTGPSESTSRPSVSTSRTVPPTSLTPTQPTMYAGSNFPDNDKIIKLLHVIIEQNTKLEHKLDAMNRRLITIEAKQDTMIDLLQRCDKFIEYET